jgi:hypothetical protein
MRFFEEKARSISAFLGTGNRRYLFTLAVASFVKVVVFSSVAILLSGVPVSEFPAAVSPIPWLRYFYAWDSGWYAGIATSGWNDWAYVFFPLYPTLMKYVGIIVGGDVVLAGFLISIILGAAWIPFFENIAEDYMNRRQALLSTLAAACFPYVLVFTSVVYSESLFFFSTILAWFLYKKNRLLLSGVMAGMATLTKPYGILILIPMIADALAKRNWRRLPAIAMVPCLSLLGWMGYLYATTGDAFAFLTARQYWVGAGNGQNTFWWMVSPIFANNPMEYLTQTGSYHISYGGDWLNVPYMAITIFVLFGIMVLKVWDFDWRLALFSTSLMTIFLVEGFVGSLVRYFAFVFPIWFTIRVQRSWTLALLIVFFAAFTVALWYQFLMGWIG